MSPVKIDVAASVYAASDAAVIVAPAIVLRWDAIDAAISPTHGLDLVAGSAAVALGHAAVAWRRLRRTADYALRRADVWIAAIDALVVLSLGATALLAAVLVGFAVLHTRLAARGWPVVALWVGVQLVAVIAAEFVGRGVFRWLEPATDRNDETDTPTDG
jgi:small-conductance mechanosensitive channel